MSDEKESGEDKKDSAAEADKKERTSRLGMFIQTYHAFLSTFVIGAAGLVATSIWQWKQAEIAQKQAVSQQRVAQSQADNSWRIERAEILSKNLQVLSTTGPNNAEQRYGVLLSLTRGNIIDPELAISYALELGRDNSEYMRSVLSNTSNKSWWQLVGAFKLSCLQRFGLSRDIALCKNDKMNERSDALSDLMADELESGGAQNKSGPAVLLSEERQAQMNAAKLTWLFNPYLERLYAQRQWAEIEHFEALSPGARLISALALGWPRPDDIVAPGEAPQINKFHDDRARWLSGYLIGSECGAACKGQIADVMLTLFAESKGRYAAIFRDLLVLPRDEIAQVVARLHQRLTACAIDQEDLTLRDEVLVPLTDKALSDSKVDPRHLDDMIGLLALCGEPSATGDAAALAAFKAVLAKAQKLNRERYERGYVARRAAAQSVRQNPPVALRPVLFCGAANSTEPAAPSPL